MEEGTFTDWILDTIDQLRKRKARPDLERICHMVERKHGPSFADIAAELDKLVEAQVVVKVDYKGSTSYRNAAKWRKSHFGNVQNSASTSAELEGAVRALSTSKPTGDAETGEEKSAEDAANIDASDNAERAASENAVKAVSKESIEKWLLEHDPNTKLTGEALQVALDREVEAYNLEKRADGGYVIGDPSKKPPPPEKPEKTKTPKSNRPKNPKPKVKKQAANADGATSVQIKKEKGVEDGGATSNAGPVGAQEKLKPLMPVKTEKCDNVTIKQEPLNDQAQQQASPNNQNIGHSPMKSPGKVTQDVKDKHITPSKKGRPASAKRKRIKKSHGPEFEESFTPPKAKERRRISLDRRSSHSHEYVEEEDQAADEEVANTVPGSPPESAPPTPRCDFCLLTSGRNRNGVEEQLLSCKDCQAKAHPSCMNYSEALARRARNSPWQCIECKTCYICTDSRDPDAMLFCDACDKGYHMDCHNPPVLTKPTGKWVCTKCINEGITEEDMEVEDATSNSPNNYNSDGGGVSCLPTPTESPLHFDPDHKFSSTSSSSKMNGGSVPSAIPKLAQTMKADVPDASNWTIKDVVDFFTEMGFSQQADVFQEQEIDGKSLLLMKRSDVLQGLGLKLGPALKIYAHVQRLQTRGQIVF